MLIPVVDYVRRKYCVKMFSITVVTEVTKPNVAYRIAFALTIRPQSSLVTFLELDTLQLLADLILEVV